MDQKNYRIAEGKDLRIRNVMRILKKGAVDCALNLEGNIHPNKKSIQTTSSGVKLNVNTGDTPFSRQCDYDATCKYKCNWMPDKKLESEINTDTYNIRFAKTDIEDAKAHVKTLFKKDVIFQLSNIEEYVRDKMPDIEDRFIYKAIDLLLESKEEPIFDKYDRQGYIILSW